MISTRFFIFLKKRHNNIEKIDVNRDWRWKIHYCLNITPGPVKRDNSNDYDFFCFWVVIDQDESVKK